MKTYILPCIFMACLAMGCSKEEVGDEGIKSSNLIADYTVLLKKDGVLQTTYLNADKAGITINTAKGDIEVTTLPHLSYRYGAKMGFFNSLVDCSGTIGIHDFNDNTVVNATVFSGDGNCDFLVKSMAFSGDKAFLAYVAASNTEKDSYYFKDFGFIHKPQFIHRCGIGQGTKATSGFR